jgi:hypothetical protein
MGGFFQLSLVYLEKNMWNSLRLLNSDCLPSLTLTLITRKAVLLKCLFYVIKLLFQISIFNVNDTTQRPLSDITSEAIIRAWARDEPGSVNKEEQRQELTTSMQSNNAFDLYAMPNLENIASKCFHTLDEGPSWPWLYGSWMYIYLCNQFLSPLMLWIRISFRARCTTLCDKVCQWLATCRWFSPGPPVSSTNKTDHYNITEILLKVALSDYCLTPTQQFFSFIMARTS